MGFINSMGVTSFLVTLSIVNAVIIRPHVIEAAHGVPPRMRDVETKFRVPLGQKQFKLICPIISGGKDSSMVQWFKNGEQLDWDSSYKISKDGKELKMKSVKFEDSGRYQCQATNGFGHKTVEFIVHVHDQNDRGNSVKDYLVLSNSTASPSWLVDMNTEWRSPIKINTGGKLELRCPAQGNPLPEIRWYHNDFPVTENTHKHVSSMFIDPVDATNSGHYRCNVENTLGSLTFTFDVSVGDYFDPPTTETAIYQEQNAEPIIDQPYNITVYAGHSAQFQCKVKSAENTLIKWLKEVSDPEIIKRQDPNATIIHANGMHLLVLDHVQTKESISMETNGENTFINRLTIENVYKEHAGKYICVVTSAQGHIVYKYAELEVLPRHNFPLGFFADRVLLSICALVIVFVIIVVMAIIWLKKNQEPNGKLDMKPPPPPRMPPPAAPQDLEWASDRTLHSTKPLLLNNSMFQQTNSMKYQAATMDRNMIHRTERRFDEVSNVYDNGSVQPYWTQQRNNNSIYNGCYRTLEVYNHRNYPTSEEYSDNDNFYCKR